MNLNIIDFVDVSLFWIYRVQRKGFECHEIYTVNAKMHVLYTRI